jgi:hypothetical protein
MKRTPLFIALLALIAVVSGCLMSGASWISRVGMTFFHKEYNFLKVWWQGTIALFLIFMLLFLFHNLLLQKLPLIAAKAVHVLVLLFAAAGLYYTHDDFTQNLSHRLLGWHFHYGFYLFWTGWILTCLFFIFKRKRTITIITSSDKTEIADQ